MSLNSEIKDTPKMLHKMPIFDGDEKNWTSWKRMFRSFLRRNSKDEFRLLDAVTKMRNSGTELSKDLLDEDLIIQLFDSLVLSCRGQAAAVLSTLPHEDDEDGAKAWLALLAKYEVHTRARFVNIHHQILNARLDMADPDEYFHKIDLLRKQLSEVSADRRLMSDEEMISFALFALPPEVAYLRSILEANPNLTYALLKSHVRSAAEGCSNGAAGSQDTVLISNASQRRFRGTCFKCGQRGHRANQCRNTKKLSESNVCDNCGRSGHDTKMCFAPGGAKHHANVARTQHREYAFSATDT